MRKNISHSVRSSQLGFSLIELLVVVVVIGILSAFAVPKYQEAVRRAQTSKAKAVVSAIEKAKDQKIIADFKLVPDTNYDTAFNTKSDDVKLAYLSEFLAQNGLTPTAAELVKGTGKTSLNVGTMTNNGSQRMVASFN